MIYEIQLTNQFKKDYKRLKERGLNITKLNEIITILSKGESLPPSCNNHKLKGEYEGYWECHIQPDWLLIYYINSNRMVLVLTRTGSHSDLF